MVKYHNIRTFDLDKIYKKPNAYEKRLLRLEWELQQHIIEELDGKPFTTKTYKLFNQLQKGWKELR